MRSIIKASIIIMILVSIILLCNFLPFIQGKHIEAIKIDTEIETSKWFQNRVQSYDIIQCKFGFKKMAYSFVYENKFESLVDYHIFFFEISKDNIFKNTVNSNYTGGTTVKNTTFPQLVEMVKEDCGQFQGGFVNEYPNGIHWTYTRADTTEEKADDIRKFSYGELKLFPEFMDAYGDIDEMTDEEVIALHERIKKEGLDENVQMADQANDIREELYELSKDQLGKMIKKYGEWSNFTNEELLEWTDIIKADMDSGEFELD